MSRTASAETPGTGETIAIPVDFAGVRSTPTRANRRNPAAAARPSPSPSQFILKLRRFGKTPAVAVPRPATSINPCSIRAARSGEGACGRSFFNSFSSSVKSFMGDKVFLERRQRIAIARRRRVLGNSEDSADVRKGQFVPDFHDQHLALLGWKEIDRRNQRALRSIVKIKLRSGRVLHLERSARFAAGAAGIAPEKIERDRADRGVKERTILDRMLFAPEPDERVLDDVLGVRGSADKLAGKEDKPRPQFRETNFPFFFMSDDIFHDLLTVF